MVKLNQYLPNYYDGVYEMQELTKSEQNGFDDFDDEVNRWLVNQFVTQADSDGLSIFENQLKIETDLSKSLESRRYDILIRMLPPHPITFRYFQDLITSFDIKTTLKRDVFAQLIQAFTYRNEVSDEQLDRLKYLMNVYVPANMIYEIMMKSESQTNFNWWLGVVSYSKVTTVVKAKTKWISDLTTAWKIGMVYQIKINSTINAKKEVIQ
ncbi:DUF2313 domain-containing protein [Lentilactobacillus senioris]|uniref:putative phage tail protein n=1 Tax=Lentilactobacillus senioris TaxID=931534 RepID=UPI00227FA7B8|nr:putative phage tail protein [Lentilactobacillus senioris]MCY9807449.1 DUF2313 domain-containing protein [Lentilactobacillus senioris]